MQLRIAHLSDFHVFAGGEKPELIRPDVADCVRLVARDVAEFTPAIDAVMITGDLSGNARPADYVLLKELLSPIDVPVFVVPGNHDEREPFREAFGDMYPFEPGEFLQYETYFKGIRILGLDTLLSPYDAADPSGELCPSRLAWIAEKLAQPHDGLTYILMHHAPYLCGIRFLDGIGLLRGGEEFGRLVRPHAERLRILCGHIHRPSVSRWNGVFTMVGGSPSYSIGLDLTGSEEEPSVDKGAPYGYPLHSLEPSGKFVVNLRFVGLPPWSEK